jgi:hypothetical protein
MGSGVCSIAGAVAVLTNGASPRTELAFCVAIPSIIAINAIAFFKMENSF